MTASGSAGPDGRFGALIVLGGVAVDGGLEVDQGMERPKSMRRRRGDAISGANETMVVQDVA